MSQSPLTTRSIVLCGIGVALLFVGYSFWRIPIPGVNEPHYLCKAKAFWDSEWCEEDFFLHSSNPHYVYYATIGPLTKVCSLEQTAVVARVVSLSLLGFGWTVFAVALGLRPPMTLLCGSVILVQQATFNYSGEWFIGGTESKVFAYAFVLFSLAAWVRGKSWQAWLFSGLVVSFHPVVGVWNLLCILGTDVLSSPFWKWSLCNLAINLLVFCLFAAPGLIPALAILSDSPDPKTTFNANYIQIFYRLKHHLDPMSFDRSNGEFYAAALLATVALSFFFEKMNRVRGYLLLSALVAGVGIALGWRDDVTTLPTRDSMPYLEQRIALLKFYPFRLIDAGLPVMATLLLGRTFQSMILRIPWAAIRYLYWIPTSLGACSLLYYAATVDGHDRNPSRMNDALQADWLETCQWVREQTPPSAYVVTPRESWAFKWFAQRAEYVSFKDCPQEAEGIVEWNHRLNWLDQWARMSRRNGSYDPQDLLKLHQETGATHLITRRLGPFTTEPSFRNRSYRVYALEPDASITNNE